MQGHCKEVAVKFPLATAFRRQPDPDLNSPRTRMLSMTMKPKRPTPTSFRVAALASALLLAGCASFNGSSLVSGQSRAADVEAVMGTPSEKTTDGNGDAIWFYVRGPAARQTFAARIGPDGVLKGIEPRLTKANVARLQIDRSMAQEIPGAARASQSRAPLRADRQAALGIQDVRHG